MRLVRTAAAGFVILSALASAEAQDLGSHPRMRDATKLLETWLEAQRAYDEVPGISGSVVYDQQVVWKGAYGLADVARRAPATTQTLYSICSISKLFTSVGVLQQRDAGKLRLDDPVSRHLSWFNIRKSNPESGPVTVEGLLTHSSGLPRESDHPYWTGPDFPFPTHDEIVAHLGRQETLYPAATYFQYSNLGLTLAGEVVSATSGMPYAEYIKSRILDPIGMTSTYTDIPEGERGKRLAIGYSAITRDGDRKPMSFFQAKGIAPAAGFASTVEDLARFSSWQFRALKNPKDPVLGANTLREMHRVHWTDPDFTVTWGLGFSVWRSGDKTFVGHGGSCPGFRSHVLLRPEEKVATVFMSNALGVNSQQWAQRMYDIMAPAIRAATRDTTPPKAQDPELEKYLGTYESSFGGEVAVVRWEGGISTLFLPTMDPVRALTKLRKTGEHTFRRVRSDETLGEEYRFVMGADGRPTHYVVHNNLYRRVK